jgi:hypothetical protein
MDRLPKGWELIELSSLCEFENGDRGKNYVPLTLISNTHHIPPGFIHDIPGPGGYYFFTGFLTGLVAVFQE